MRALPFSFQLQYAPSDPPPKYDTLVDGHRTPKYALAWRANPFKLSKLVTEDPTLEGLDMVLALRWVKLADEEM